jgi:hypothetical protein
LAGVPGGFKGPVLPRWRRHCRFNTFAPLDGTVFWDEAGIKRK